jgi:hypothetical protein
VIRSSPPAFPDDFHPTTVVSVSRPVTYHRPAIKHSLLHLDLLQPIKPLSNGRDHLSRLAISALCILIELWRRLSLTMTSLFGRLGHNCCCFTDFLRLFADQSRLLFYLTRIEDCIGVGVQDLDVWRLIPHRIVF